MSRSLLASVCVAATLVVSSPASAQCLATHGTIVAVGCESLALSRDDGATFTDTHLRIAGVTVTDDDRVFVVNDAEPPSLFEVGAGHEALPLAHVDAIAHVGRSVVVVGSRVAADPQALPRTAVIVRSHDGTLRELASLEGWTSAMRVSVSGTERAPRVELVVAYGLSCWGTVEVRRMIVDASGVELAHLLDDTSCAYHSDDCAGFFDVELGAHGSAYAVAAPRDDGAEPAPQPLLFVRPTERIDHTTLSVPTGAYLTIAHNGRVTLALLDGVLHRLEGTRVTRLGGRIDADAQLVHVDDRGRPFAVTTAGTFRFSRRGGWTLLRDA